MIKAIDTRYKNRLFRSRLEARWAVYFDELGVGWDYEQEGFELGNGERYLPDFLLSRYDLYAEIKPKEFTFKEHSKCRRLALLTNKIVIELVGLPNTNIQNVIIPSRSFLCPTYGAQTVYADHLSKRCKCGVDHRITSTLHEAEGVLMLCSGKDSYKPIFYGQYDNDDWSDKVIQKAIRLSMEARFEFNH